MKIVVCVKPVKTELVYSDEKRDETFVMNPYDLYALKKCLDIKKETNCSITCICMAPKSSEYILVKALAMGVDSAVLLSDAAFSGSDTVATTYILSRAIKKIGGVDIVVMGQRSIDGETGQVVLGIAERLGYPCITRANELMEITPSTVIVNYTKNDFKFNAKVEVPFVLAFKDFELSQPDISLLALKRAQKKEIIVWDSRQLDADISKCGVKGSRTKVVNIKSEIVKKVAEELNGTVAEKAEFIIRMALKGEKSGKQ